MARASGSNSAKHVLATMIVLACRMNPAAQNSAFAATAQGPNRPAPVTRVRPPVLGTDKVAPSSVLAAPISGTNSGGHQHVKACKRIGDPRPIFVVHLRVEPRNQSPVGLDGRVRGPGELRSRCSNTKRQEHVRLRRPVKIVTIQATRRFGARVLALPPTRNVIYCVCNLIRSTSSCHRVPVAPRRSASTPVASMTGAAPSRPVRAISAGPQTLEHEAIAARLLPETILASAGCME